MAAKEQQYMAIRQILKENIRKKMYGSCKTLEQSKSSASGNSKVQTDRDKIQTLKENRDYSFLLSDDPVPMPLPTNLKETATSTDPATKLASMVMAASGKQSTSSNKNNNEIMYLEKNKTLNPKLAALVASRKQSSTGNNRIMSLEKNLENHKKTIMPLRRPEIKQNPLRVQTLKKKRHARELYADDNDEDDYDYETDKAFEIIRKMFNTKRFIGRDDADNVNMESTYKDMEKEEKRSARLASKEDQEQLRLIKKGGTT